MPAGNGIEPVNPQQEEFEKLARAWAARDQSAAPSECPNPQELFEAASGDLSGERRLAIIDHVSRCAECTEAWRLALEIGARPAADSADPGAQVSASPRAGAWRAPRFALAASVI